MIRIALRDLQFRRRRFAVAIVGAALVFALSLVVQGLSDSFDRETSDTLSSVGIGRWFVSDRSPGPFTGFTPITTTQTEQLVADSPGPVAQLLIVRQPVGTGEARTDAGLIGAVPGALGSPTGLVAGRAVVADGEAVVSVRSGAAIGSPLTVGGTALRVVGLVDTTLLGGTTNVFTTLTQAQEIVGAGPIVTVLATTAAPRVVPDGLTMMTDPAVHVATLRPLEDAIGTIAMMRSILWLVAALIVGAILYLNAMERNRDVAVMKAIGVTSRSIGGSMLIQACVIALVSSLIADGVALVLAPIFPMKVTLTPAWLAVLPVFAVVVSCVACLAAIRRAVSVSPAAAFGGS